MYLQTGLGQVFKPRPRGPVSQPPKAAPKQPPPKQGWVAKDSHRRFCLAPDGRHVGCDLELRVRFRRSFEEFLREVENAYGRWMAKPTAQMLVKKLQKTLKEWHQDMLYYQILDNDPLVLVGGLDYRRSNGTWLVDRSDLRQYRRLIDL
jgi:hypothetical protein